MKIVTRKILLSIVFCFALISARGQYVTIPDSVFGSWLMVNYPSCMNGNQMDTTCAALSNVNAINFINYNIYDFTGISYFHNLKHLTCRQMHLTSLPKLPDSLNFLDCSFNQLTSLPTLPSFLKYFDCGSNLLTSLPPLPDSMTFFNCVSCHLTSLPTLPDSLTTFDCRFNQLTTLPPLPALLTQLPCNNNALTSLPLLPSGLTYIWCENNQLTSLPQLPPQLGGLQCDHNHLISLPPLPTSISTLDCSNNNLTSLPSLPDTIYILYIDENPNLTCLPSIHSIHNFDWYNTSITCLPNVMSIDNQYPSIAGLPICDWYNNVHNCPIYWNIKGTIFTDNNMNCLIDSSEKLNGNIKLNLYENGNLIQQTFTNVLGEYSFDTDTGTYTYTIDTTGLPYKINCPAAGNYTTSVTSANPINDGKDFSIECKPSFDVGVKSIVRKSGIFFPGDSATLYVLAGDISNLYNLKCASGISGTVSVTIYGAASFIDAANGALIPTVSGNILTYAIADFGAVNLLSDFGVIVLTHTNAQINDQVCFVVAVTPLSGDNNTTNNNYTQCFTVGNSYDPNEKEVYPSGTIDSSQHSLTYSIHFQNTGNSAAQHIYILDTLDISIDESSIQLLAYSHEPIVQVIGNVLKFNFPNVNLPDSGTNQALSNGYVQYRVRLKPNVQLGTVVSNTSYIYFDFNTPVQTNVVNDTVTNCHNLLTVYQTNHSLCNGDTLFANALLAYSANIEWYLDSVFFSSDATLAVPNLLPGFYQIECIATNAYCTQQISSDATIHSLPPTFNLGNDTSTCNIPIVLDAGAGNNFYLWSTGETTQAIIASITASYSVVVADSIGCKNSDTVRVTINTLPLVTLNSIGNSDTLCMSWGNVNLNNGVPVGGTYSGSGVSGNSFNPSSAGVGWHTIFYSYTDSTGCNNFTSRAVYVTVCTGINQLNSIDKIKIYPNPIISGNDLTLIYNTRTNTLSTFNIYDVSGRNVFSKPILSSNETQTITLPILAIGVYDCVINSANGCSHQKLVIMD